MSTIFRRRFVVALLAAAGLAALVSSAASGSGATPTVRSAHVSSMGQTIVVGTHGRTLYVLLPETTHHLLCKSSACLSAWPLYTVSSAHAALRDGSGVHGALGVIRRGHTYQVTLRGHPLYRYAGDSANGQVNGQLLRSFGGTWHVLVAGGGISNRSASHTTGGGGW